MKIVIICGSLEPGKCGVGDYTRRLAKELLELGHACVLIAVSDHCVRAVESKVDQKGGVYIGEVRYPRNMSWRKRYLQVVDLVQYVNPDHINIQFVPYMYSKKGIPLGFYYFIRKLYYSFNTSASVMFHELWIYSNANMRSSRKLISILQSAICVRIATLNSPVVFTNTKFHRKRLSQFGIDAVLMPLFGNIPVQKGRATLPNDLEGFVENRLLVIHFGSFGNPNEGALGETLEALVLNLALNKKLVLIAFGIGGPFEKENRLIAERILGISKVRFIGQVDASAASVLMKRASIGLTRSKMHNWEKSGAVAAMFEHGLRVISYSKESYGERVEPVSKIAPNEIARQFIESILGAAK